MKKTIDLLTDIFWSVIAYTIIFIFVLLGVIGEFVKWVRDTAVNVKNLINYVREIE